MHFIARPEWLAVLLGCVIGLSNLILTPPFQAPDEEHHFFRAYQIAAGELLGKKANQRVGGTLPTSLVAAAKRFEYLKAQPHLKTSKQEIETAFEVPLQPEQHAFVDFPTNAMYAPISYAPQATALFLATPVRGSPLTLLYITRVVSLLCWLVVLFFAIRLIPFQKDLFLLLGLLPMSTFVNASCSADVVTNALGFLSIAIIFRAIYRTAKLAWAELLGFAVLIALLASAKLLYVPVFLLLLFVPASRFGSAIKKWSTLAVLGLLGLSIVAIWSSLMADLYTPYADYNPAFRDGVALMKCANMAAQKEYMLQNGFYSLQVILRSIDSAFEMYSNGFIGTFGHLDTYLPTWTVQLGWAGIFFISLFGGRSDIRLKLHLRIAMVCVGGFVVLLILLSQQLTWDCVGSGVVSTLQGRYFIPLAPVVFLALYSPKTRFASYGRWISLLLILVLNATALHTIYTRYYVPASFEIQQFACGAEKIEGNQLMAGHVGLNGAECRTNKVSRTGDYSAELTPEHAFAYILELEAVRPGDIVQVTVWRNTSHGALVVRSKNDRFYHTHFEATEQDAQGWQKLEARIEVGQVLRGNRLTISCWNPDSVPSYFDDFVVKHYKMQ